MPLAPRPALPNAQPCRRHGPLRCVWARGTWALVAWAAMAAGSLAATPTAKEIELQLSRGDVAGAGQRLAQALAESPSDAGLRFLQAVMAGEAGRTAEAAALLERMTQDYPELPEPYNNLAVLRAAADQLDAARELLETALRLAPDYRGARVNLGDVHARLALRAYSRAAQGAAATEPALQRKLLLARELGGVR